MLSLGNLVLFRDGDKIWIQDVVSGEGGSFPAADIEALVLKHFVEMF